MGQATVWDMKRFLTILCTLLMLASGTAGIVVSAPLWQSGAVWVSDCAETHTAGHHDPAGQEAVQGASFHCHQIQLSAIAPVWPGLALTHEPVYPAAGDTEPDAGIHPVPEPPPKVF